MMNFIAIDAKLDRAGNQIMHLLAGMNTAMLAILDSADEMESDT